jgi:hypothetical protein
MFGVKFLIDNLNTAINSGTLTDLQLAQASSAIEALEKRGVASVATAADLPNPVTNTGRFLFIESENRYVFSNGVVWDVNNIIAKPLVNAWSWGYNVIGQLGDNTTTSRLSPVSVVGGFTDWVQISAGESHTAAVRANGTAWAWGSNGNGLLGDNTVTARSSPVSVVGGFTDWVQISAGTSHTAAVRANGTAWAWGYNALGRLGDNTTLSRVSPVSVVGGFTDWVQIAAGGGHTAAVRSQQN